MRSSFLALTIPVIVAAGLTARPPLASAPQSPDTLRVGVGSELISGVSLPLHGSTIDRLMIDPGQAPRKVGWITNVMTLGDSAGREVFRFRTDGENRLPDGKVNRYTLYTTFDRQTTALLQYNWISATTGREVKVSFDGLKVRGTSRANADAEVQQVDVTLSRAGFLGSSMDIQLSLLPLKPGLAIEMPIWMPGLTDVETRWYVVKEKGTARMGGKTVEGWVTEEWNGDRTKKISTLNLIKIAPFMEWQEFDQPSGAKLRLVQELM